MPDNVGLQPSLTSNQKSEAKRTSQTPNLESPKGRNQDEEKQTTKRKTFQMSGCAPKKVARPPQHRLSQLQKGQSNPTSFVAPSEAVVRKLSTAKMVMGVDIETNDFVIAKRRLSKGKFGFASFCAPEDFIYRIVQIGWAIGEAREGTPVQESKEYLIRPEGFCISTKAANKHGITNERALAEGVPLPVALADFVRAMTYVDDLGGRVVIHHLEFDAGIIFEELRQAGLECWQRPWCEIAKKGICTLDPDIWRWVQMCFGLDPAQGDKTLVMSLGKAVDLLLPQTTLIQTLKKDHHTAGADAQLHRLLYIALRQLCDEANKS